MERTAIRRGPGQRDAVAESEDRRAECARERELLAAVVELASVRPERGDSGVARGELRGVAGDHGERAGREQGVSWESARDAGGEGAGAEVKSGCSGVLQFEKFKLIAGHRKIQPRVIDASRRR